MSVTDETISMPGHPYARQLDYDAWVNGEEVPWIDWVWAKLDAASTTYLKYKVNWKPVRKGKWTLEHGNIPLRCYERLHHVCDGAVPSLDRDCGHGPTTVLKHDGQVWMSDTRAEILEHSPLINWLFWCQEVTQRPRVLINGLGLGMAVNAALIHNAAHVDVVEIDQEVIDIIGPNFEGKPVTIHHGDALTIEWPEDQLGWDLAWHDIWPVISEDNLEQMEALEEKYAELADWQASWAQKQCQQMKEHGKALAAAMARGDWAEAKRLDPDL